MALVSSLGNFEMEGMMRTTSAALDTGECVEEVVVEARAQREGRGQSKGRAEGGTRVGHVWTVQFMNRNRRPDDVIFGNQRQMSISVCRARILARKHFGEAAKVMVVRNSP